MVMVMRSDPDRFPDTDHTKIALGDEEMQKYFIESTVNLNPPRSDWQCILFGGPTSVVFTPAKGQEPNWFHRKMQELCFGVKWKKVK